MLGSMDTIKVILLNQLHCHNSLKILTIYLRTGKNRILIVLLDDHSHVADILPIYLTLIYCNNILKWHQMFLY